MNTDNGGSARNRWLRIGIIAGGFVAAMAVGYFVGNALWGGGVPAPGTAVTVAPTRVVLPTFTPSPLPTDTPAPATAAAGGTAGAATLPAVPPPATQAPAATTTAATPVPAATATAIPELSMITFVPPAGDQGQPVATATHTPAGTPTNTPLMTPTWTPLPLTTATPTFMPTATETPAPTSTATAPPTATSTDTSTATATPTATPTATAEATAAITATASVTATTVVTSPVGGGEAATPAATATATAAQEATITPTGTAQPTATSIPTVTLTPVETPTPGAAITPTAVVTVTPEITATATSAPPAEGTPTPGTPTPTATMATPGEEGTITPTATATTTEAAAPPETAVVTPTKEITVTPELTMTPTPSVTATVEITVTPELTMTPTPGVTATEEITIAPGLTMTPSVTATEEITAGESITATPGLTATPALTAPPALTESAAVSEGVPVSQTIRFASTPVTETAVGETYVYTIEVAPAAAISPGLAAPFTVTAPVLPAWLSLEVSEAGSSMLTGQPSSAETGSHHVVLEAADDMGITATQSFTIAVVQPAPVFSVTTVLTEVQAGVPGEGEIVIKVDAVLTVTAGEAVTAPVTVESPDGQAVTITVEGLPPGLTWTGREITGAVAVSAVVSGENASQAYTTTIQAVGAGGGTATATIKWFVRGPSGQAPQQVVEWNLPVSQVASAGPGRGPAVDYAWSTPASLGSCPGFGDLLSPVPTAAGSLLADRYLATVVDAPVLTFTVAIAQPGRYAVFACACAPEYAAGAAVSPPARNEALYVGLDGAPYGVSSDPGPISGFAGVPGFTWQGQARQEDGALAPVQFLIVEPGTYAVNVWMADDGVLLAGLRLTPTVDAAALAALNGQPCRQADFALVQG